MYDLSRYVDFSALKAQSEKVINMKVIEDMLVDSF
jgi:hypothetical protein